VIYFCHIPRTSGTSVSNAVYDSFNKALRIPIKPDLEKFDPHVIRGINKTDYQSFLKECYLNIDFFYGHHFFSPYIEPYSESLETFSIIRNPLERMISEFYYYNRNVSDSRWKNNKIHQIKNFLYSPNNLSQCYWLLGDYDWEKMKLTKNTLFTHWLQGKEISFEEILQTIKKGNIKLSTLENRTYLLNELEVSLNKIKKTNISLDKELKVNENFNIEKRPEFNNPECFLSQQEIETFKNLYSLDYQLYNYVKDHETRTGRCLTPDDILF